MAMWRAIPSSRRDDGFTVVELVIAAAILFFAMTALVGLLGASTSMTASAKSRSVLTNAISSELERIRALRIEEVDYSTSGGQIPHSKVLPVTRRRDRHAHLHDHRSNNAEQHQRGARGRCCRASGLPRRAILVVRRHPRQDRRHGARHRQQRSA